LEAFNRGCDLAQETISYIVMLWQVTFPGIASTNTLSAVDDAFLSMLFPQPYGPSVLKHK
jgi:hypothetical protein